MGQLTVVLCLLLFATACTNVVVQADANISSQDGVMSNNDTRADLSIEFTENATGTAEGEGEEQEDLDWERDVVVLTTQNFTSVVKNSQYALVSASYRHLGPLDSSLHDNDNGYDLPVQIVYWKHEQLTAGNARPFCTRQFRWSSTLPGAATAR